MRRRTTVFLIAAIVQIGVFMANPTDGLGSGGKWKYSFSYSFQTGETEKNRLSIDPAGNVIANVRYSQPGMVPRALGWFHERLEPADGDLASLGRLIRDKGLIERRAKSIAPTYGMRSKVFTFGMDGKEGVHLLRMEETLDEGLAEAEKVVFRLFQRIEGAPSRTLAIDVGFEPTEVRRGEDFQIRLEFRGVGKFPTEFRNPANFRPGGPGSLHLIVWMRGAGEDGKPLDEFVSDIDLAGREFLAEERRAISSSEPLLQVMPGKSVRMWTTIRFPKLGPGTYTLETIYYAGPLTQDERGKRPDLIVGEFHADLRQIVVTKD